MQQIHFIQSEHIYVFAHWPSHSSFGFRVPHVYVYVLNKWMTFYTFSCLHILHINYSRKNVQINKNKKTQQKTRNFKLIIYIYLDNADDDADDDWCSMLLSYITLCDNIFSFICISLLFFLQSFQMHSHLLAITIQFNSITKL